MKNVIDPDLLRIISDFLSDRKMVVEVEGMQSKPVGAGLGCVQGSVLGLKIFNLYMRDVTKHVNIQLISTYADDSYVMITGKDIEDTITATKACMKSHLSFLRERGMVTNIEKNWSCDFRRRNYPRD